MSVWQQGWHAVPFNKYSSSPHPSVGYHDTFRFQRQQATTSCLSYTISSLRGITTTRSGFELWSCLLHKPLSSMITIKELQQKTMGDQCERRRCTSDAPWPGSMYMTKTARQTSNPNNHRRDKLYKLCSCQQHDTWTKRTGTLTSRQKRARKDATFTTAPT